jgi:hypothetical protein
MDQPLLLKSRTFQEFVLKPDASDLPPSLPPLRETKQKPTHNPDDLIMFVPTSVKVLTVNEPQIYWSLISNEDFYKQEVRVRIAKEQNAFYKERLEAAKKLNNESEIANIKTKIKDQTESEFKKAMIEPYRPADL